MEIKRSGSQPSAKGPAEWFTGTVRIDPLFDAPVPARAERRMRFSAGLAGFEQIWKSAFARVDHERATA